MQDLILSAVHPFNIHCRDRIFYTGQLSIELMAKSYIEAVLELDWNNLCIKPLFKFPLAVTNRQYLRQDSDDNIFIDKNATITMSLQCQSMRDNMETCTAGAETVLLSWNRR